MSTKAALRKERNITEQVSATKYDTYAYKNAPNSGVFAWPNFDSTLQPAYVREDPKATEAQRQIARARSIAHRSVDLEDPEAQETQRKSIETCISLIWSLMTGPIPIPVASSGEECGATLFWQGSGVYADLEISGDTVEYYLKSITDEGEQVVFDTETVEYGFVPPRLLAHLFSIYAR